MIQPVIVEVASNREAVQRLVTYARELDGTEIKVVRLPPEEDDTFVPDHPDNAKACRQSFALHKAALAMNGKPFIWVEPDSIPLKAGWAKAIEKEYKRLKKPFLLSTDSHPPHDLVGGIGVYSGDTAWMIPQHYRRDPTRCVAWDLWMIKNMPELIARTPLIQHSYGIYDQNGNATLHSFPRDAGMLRPEAVIFHKDNKGELMNPENRQPPERVFAHAGDLGDIIYALPVIQRMGGGHLMLCPDMGLKAHSHCRETMTEQRFDLILPLLIHQPYIASVNFSPTLDPSWINLNLFREKLKPKESLQRACLRRFGLPVQDETSPWLTATKWETVKPTIAVARSPRYHNDMFPWKRLVEAFRTRMIFLGLDTEYSEFSREFGEIVFHSTQNLKCVAALIDSCCLFIGNQSAPYAIAEGLKKPAVQETWNQESNCCFQRPDALFHTSDFRIISDFIDRYI